MKIENVAVISLEDYAEYMELKANKNKVDYSKLKTGSVVRLNLDKEKDLTVNTSGNYYSPKEYTLILINSNLIFNSSGVSSRKVDKKFTTAISNSGLFLNIIDFNATHVSEVISY